MRRTVGLLLSFAMIFSLAACSSSEASERQEEQPDSVSVQSEEVRDGAGDNITDMTQQSDEQRNMTQDTMQETEGQAKEQQETGTETEVSESVPAEGQETDMAAKTLVVYFSATGTTEPLAEYAAEILGADIYEIMAEEPYTEADLAYYTGGRADQEQTDPDVRPVISGSVENMDSYDTILLGYPKMEQGFESVLCVKRLKIEENRNGIHKQKENCVWCCNSWLAGAEFWKAAFYVAL